MTPLDFIAAVLPSPGNGRYCVVELTSKKKEHVYVERLEETEEVTSGWLENKNDIYFALSTFREKGKRTADNAQSIRTVAIDMDGYATKQAAAMALNGFLETTGLDAFGTPWVVASGGGLHCYWTFREALDLAIWKPVAENFKRLCKQEKLEIDMTVTADASRVLRIPGTMNFKKNFLFKINLTHFNLYIPMIFTHKNKNYYNYHNYKNKKLKLLLIMILISNNTHYFQTNLLLKLLNLLKNLKYLKYLINLHHTHTHTHTHTPLTSLLALTLTFFSFHFFKKSGAKTNIPQITPFQKPFNPIT
jgi:hypothetical protein